MKYTLLRAFHGMWAPTAADARNRGPVCVNYFLDTHAIIALLKNQPARLRGRLRRVGIDYCPIGGSKLRCVVTGLVRQRDLSFSSAYRDSSIMRSSS